MRIMLVDDDQVIREGMKKIIIKADCGWDVVAEASDGEIALQCLDEIPDIDLIITDIRMPIMDGIELIKQVREKNDIVKIIVLSGYDDFSYVRNAFVSGATDYLLKPFQKEDLLTRIKMIEANILTEKQSAQYGKKNRDVLIADVMWRFFKGGREEVQQNIQQLKMLGVDTDFSCYMVMDIRADQYYKQYQDIQQYEKQLREDAAQVLVELEKKEGFEYCYSINGQEMLILLFCNNEEQSEQVAKRIFDVLCNKRDEMTTDTLAMSKVHSDVSEMATAYLEAKEAALARFYLGQNKMIRYNEIAGKCIDISYDLEAVVGQLVQCLELCDYINAKKVIEQIFLDLSYCKPDKFRQYMHNLMGMLIVRVKDFENALIICGQDYQFNIDYLNTYRELKGFMNSVMQGTVEYIKGEKEKKSKRRVELAKTYIEEHYQEQITLNDVADYVELNTSYFSHLFKGEMGMNFSEYLLNIRMERAKQLLRDPKIKVYEIGNLVGYEDAVSFGRAFKKKLGMSPKEYRNSVY